MFKKMLPHQQLMQFMKSTGSRMLSRHEVLSSDSQPLLHSGVVSGEIGVNLFLCLEAQRKDWPGRRSRGRTSGARGAARAPLTLGARHHHR